MEEGSRRRVMCTILSVDHTDMFYIVCTVCERTLPNPSSTCHSSNPPSKRLFRILVSCSISVPFLFSSTKYNIKTFFFLFCFFCRCQLPQTQRFSLPSASTELPDSSLAAPRMNSSTSPNFTLFPVFYATFFFFLFHIF